MPQLSLIVLVALIGLLMVRAVATGLWGWGAASTSRADNPGDFYFLLILFGLVGACELARLVYHYRVGEVPNWPITEILFGALAAQALVKSLRSGEALDPAFSRREEPVQYWAIVAMLVAVIGGLAWMAVRTLSR